MFLILYVVTYTISDHFGSYQLYGDDDGVVYWVWRGAYQWRMEEGNISGRDQSPTILAVIYLPLSIFDRFVLNRHITLVASAPVADRVYYNYPGLGLRWNEESGAFFPTVVIPGETSNEAETNYLKHIDARGR